MRLTSIAMKHVGPYQSSLLQFEQSGLQLLYGENETGKSTLLAAIRGGLFGQPRLAEGSVATRSGSSVTLSLENEQGETITVDRVLSKKSPPTLRFANGSSATGQSALLDAFPELKGIEQLLFEAFFTVQLADLVSFSEHPEAVSQVFGIRAPLLNPYVFEDKLEKRAREIYIAHSRATRPTLNRLQRDYNQLLRKIAEQHDGRAWYERTELERDRLETQREELAAQLNQLQERKDFYQQCVNLHDQVLRLYTVEEALRTLGDCPPGNYERWASAGRLLGEAKELAQAISNADAEHHRLKQRIVELDSRRDWLEVRPQLTPLLSDVQHARQIATALSHAMTELDNHRGAAQGLDFVVPDGWTDDDIKACATETDDWKALLKAARWKEDCANKTLASTERLREETAVCEAHKAEFARRIGSSYDDVDAASNAFVSRKQTLEQSLNDLRDDLRDLERLVAQPATDDADRNHPKRRLQLPFIWTGGLLLAGSIIDFVAGSNMAGLLFAIAAAMAFAYPFMAQMRKAEMPQNDFKNSLLSQLRHVPEDGETPRTMLSRLRTLQTQGKQTLESLLMTGRALEAWQHALEQVRVKDAELTTALGLEREAALNYVSLLDEVRLPNRMLSAADLIDMCHRAARYLSMQENVQVAIKQVDERQAELRQLVQRIETNVTAQTTTLAVRGTDIAQLAVERVASPIDVRSALDALASLSKEWLDMVEGATADHVQQTRFMEQRNRLAADTNAQRGRLELVRTEIDTIYTELRIDDDVAYQHLMEREQRRLTLHEERTRLLGDLLVACGGERRAVELASHVHQTPLELLQQNLRHADEAYSAISEQMTARQEDIWKLGQALDASHVDTDGSEQRFELARMEASMQEAKKSYVATLLAKTISKRARVTIESTQVLPVLELASSYLAKLTDSRYRELRIPLGDDGMKRMQIGDRQGYHWALDDLSRGTRELVYLALRMAVVREYRAKGVILPMVLDDPLVNFDDGRAHNVLDLLCSEARSQPIIYLTCHKRFLDDLGDDSRVNMVRAIEEGRQLEERTGSL